MSLRKLTYSAFILAFALLSGWIVYKAEEADYRNIVFLFSSLTIVALGFYFESRNSGPNDYTDSSEKGALFKALVILLIGSAFRFYGLNFGLPHNFHPDEVPKVNAVMNMYTAQSMDPNYFLHPSLLLYSTYFSNYLFHLFGAEGSFQDTAFLAGRTVSAVAGSLTVLLVYLSAKEVFSRRAALLSELLIAVFPIHITCSRYLKEDALLVFFISLCFYLTLLALRKDKLIFLYLAALAAGFSASTKYSGALTVSIIAAVPWMKSKSVFPDKRFFIAGIACVFFFAAGFLIATPYSILNSQRFLKDVGYESRHMSKGHTSAVSAWSQYWMYHLSRSIAAGVTLSALVFALFKSGIILSRKNAKEFFILGLFLIFYLSAEYVKSKPAPQPERYILPCIPFLAILGGALFDDVKSKSKNKLVPYVFILAITIFPLIRSLQLASEVKDDTRNRLSRWMDENLPSGSKILTDRKSYAPFINEEKFEVKHLNGSGIFKDIDVKNLRKSGYDYLVLSSLFYDRYFSEPYAEAHLRERIRNINRSFETVKKKSPFYGTYGFHNPTLILFNLKSSNKPLLIPENK